MTQVKILVLLNGRNFLVFFAASALSLRSWGILEMLFFLKIGIELRFNMMYAMYVLYVPADKWQRKFGSLYYRTMRRS